MVRRSCAAVARRCRCRRCGKNHPDVSAVNGVSTMLAKRRTIDTNRWPKSYAARRAMKQTVAVARPKARWRVAAQATGQGRGGASTTNAGRTLARLSIPLHGAAIRWRHRRDEHVKQPRHDVQPLGNARHLQTRGPDGSGAQYQRAAQAAPTQPTRARPPRANRRTTVRCNAAAIQQEIRECRPALA